MSKDEVKIFTGSGTFKLPENKTETKKQTEEVHEHCGTPDCCGKCEPYRDDDQSLASIIYENKDMDEEFSEHCNKFFKGRAH